MAIVTRRPAGRPKTAADFSGCDNDSAAIEKREVFFRICRSLSYQDRVHVANGLGVDYSTVHKWHNGDQMPDELIRDSILKWHDKGKPLKRLLQCESLYGLY
jgi:hypothetical protein